MKAQKSKTTVTANPGELIEICGLTPRQCSLVRTAPGRARTVVVAADGPLVSTDTWPVASSDTLASVLERWLADVPIVSPEALLADFDLEDEAWKLIRYAGANVRFYLNTLKALLDDASVIALVSPGELSEPSEAIWNVRELAVELARERQVPAPAFVVFDTRGAPGVTLLCDRVLSFSNQKMRQMAIVL